MGLDRDSDFEVFAAGLPGSKCSKARGISLCQKSQELSCMAFDASGIESHGSQMLIMSFHFEESALS